MKSPDILHGNIAKSLAMLTVPIVGSVLLETLFVLVDAIWVGRAGTDAFAVVNLASFPLWMIFAVLAVVSIGTNAMVAQKLGEASLRPQAKKEAEDIASYGIAMTLYLGLLMMAGGIFYGREILQFLSENDPVLIELGYCYLGFIFLFCPIYCFNEIVSSIFRAYGDVTTPFYVMSFICLCNFALDPIFIFGCGPIPRLDVFGAAIASNIAYFLGTVAFIILMVRNKAPYRLTWRHPQRVPWQTIRSLLLIGSPPSLSSIVFSLVYMLISPVVSSFGVFAVAALGIGHKLEGLCYSIFSSISMATVTMIGQNLGAQQYDRARQIAKIAVQLAILTTVPTVLAFLLCPGFLVSWFSNDPQVHEVAQMYLRILAIAEIFASIGCIMDGIFSGAGKTWPPMCVSIPCSLLRVPIIFGLVKVCGYGITAVWVTIAIMSSLSGILKWVLFKRNIWLSDTTNKMGHEVAK